MTQIPRQTFDKERVTFNLARMKKGGENFEVVVDPDKALLYRQTKGQAIDIKEVLRAEKIFSNVQLGLHASVEHMKAIFGTDDHVAVAKIILLEGMLQLTAEHRAQLREQKHAQILNKIHMYAVDPTTGFSHPVKRIELAMEEAKIKIDEQKTVEEQIDSIVRALQPIIPIKLETITLLVHLPNPFGQKLYRDIERFGTVKKQEFLHDGSSLTHVELPAGLQQDLMDELNSKTHGAADVKKIGEQGQHLGVHATRHYEEHSQRNKR